MYDSDSPQAVAERHFYGSIQESRGGSLREACEQL
jgi:hypothetical protein